MQVKGLECATFDAYHKLLYKMLQQACWEALRCCLYAEHPT
jgi:hypothetical protein